MMLDIEFHAIDLPVELMQICGVSAACVYAVLHAASKNGCVNMSNNEIGKQCGLPGRSIPPIISKLEKLGVIERHYNSGYATIYYVKDVFHPAEQEQPKAESTEPKKATRQAEQSEQALPKVPVAPKYNFPYYVMLSTIGSPFASEFPLSEEDVDKLTDDRETEECTIPKEWAFSNDSKMVEDALKYLAYYSEIKEGEYKEFAEETIICLSEAICNGMKNTVDSVDPELVIRRLNAIIHSEDTNLSHWVEEFARMYSEKLVTVEKIYNRHAYVKTAAINYLTEHKAQVYPGFYDNTKKEWEL